MKKISIVFTVLIIALLSMLTACGKQADDPAGADGTSADAISSVSINGVSCRVDAEKIRAGRKLECCSAFPSRNQRFRTKRMLP